MTRDDLQVIAFEIILHSGDARALVHEGLDLMRNGKFDEASKKLDEANEKLLEALGRKNGKIDNEYAYIKIMYNEFSKNYSK